MNYLFIHNRNYHSSGPETYIFNFKNEISKSINSDVDIFSLAYNKNLPSKISNYYPKPYGDPNEYSFRNQKLSLTDKINVIKALFYRKDVAKKLNNLLSNSNYEVIIVSQFWGKLSPSVIYTMINKKINFMIRLSDFGLVCSKNTFHDGEKKCFLCMKKPSSVVFKKCVNNSYLKSIINYVALRLYHYRTRKSNLKYIATNVMAEEILNNSIYFLGKDVRCIETFGLENSLNNIKKKYKLIYFGRISHDKGKETIFKLAKVLNVIDKSIKILIVGDLEDENDLQLIKKITTIEYINKVNSTELSELILSAEYSLFASVWIDNLPNSFIETMQHGLPAIVNSNSSCSKYINDENGFLYDDFDNLVEVVRLIISISPNEYERMSKACHKTFKSNFLFKTHYHKILEYNYDRRVDLKSQHMNVIP